jgi:hypothetical protein
VRRSVDSYYSLSNTLENSVILENYTLSDDSGRPYDITARYFFISHRFDDDLYDRFEILTENDIGM